MDNIHSQAIAQKLLEKSNVEFLHKYLIDNGYTISCAESLTSGLVQLALSSQSGSSKYFVGGLTAYSIPMKVTLLGVDHEEAVRANAVSELVARQMVDGCTKLFSSDIAISTTGYAEPFTDDNGVDRKRQAFIGIKVNGDITALEVTSEELQDKNRVEAQFYVVNKAIELLRNLIS
ncbi:CinA family protein [Vibrio parahaemolyticus]|uniref:CinA family protein n=1 Tax=Vibrio parahaemolyticus TaxID=670 RepID=UPI001A2A2400|nr:CinA family protein [Vibrio parahaemolyticus]MEA5356785.1 CinA family protein [Vibrio parahaemolyticus]HAT8520061.1 nicotinamide-nucleotide amidohydrolase family protein [Vibrio vulnificus]